MKKITIACTVGIAFGYGIGFVHRGKMDTGDESVRLVAPVVDLPLAEDDLNAPDAPPVEEVNEWDQLFHQLSESGSASERRQLIARLSARLDSMTSGEKADLIRSAIAYPDQGGVGGLWRMATRSLGYQDTPAALALFAQLPLGERKLYSKPLIAGMALADPQAAWDWVASIKQEEPGRFIDRAFQHQLYYAAISAIAGRGENPVDALNLALEVSEPGFRD